MQSLSSEGTWTAETDNVSLLDLLIVVAERKRIVFRVTAIFAVASIVISFVLPKRYTASVTLLPPQQSTSSLSSVLASQFAVGLGSMSSFAGSSLGLKSPNETYVAMLKSRTVEDAMVRRFELMQEYNEQYLSDARKTFEHYAVIEGNGKDGLIHISIEDKDPNRAAAMANGYVEEYRKLSGHLAVTEAAQRRLFFEQQLEQAKDNLADAEEALKRTEQTTGLIQLDSQAKALIEAAATLRAQVAAKEVQIESMRTFATGENAQLIQAEQELESLQAQLAQLGGGNNSQVEGLIIPKGRVPQAGLDYVRRVRDVKYFETIFEILARQFEAAKLDEAKQGAVIQVVDPAVPPDRRSAPKRSLIVVVSTMMGSCFGIIVVLCLSAYQRLLEDEKSSRKVLLLRKALSFSGGFFHVGRRAN